MIVDEFRISHVDIGELDIKENGDNKDRLLVSWAGEFGDGKFEIGRDKEDDSFQIFFDSNETDPQLIKSILVALVDQSVIRKTVL